ncbi:MAG: AMP-binding protein [Cyanobacteria bacterium P01_A01_bin.105]
MTQYCQDLPASPGLVIIAVSDPADFLAAFLAALLNNNTMALANPNWQQQEWRYVTQKLGPATVLSDSSRGEALPRASGGEIRRENSGVIQPPQSGGSVRDKYLSKISDEPGGTLLDPPGFAPPLNKGGLGGIARTSDTENNAAHLLSCQSPRCQSPPCQSPPSGAILIPTSGTTGQPRFVIHTWATLVASARGFLEHFDSKRAHAYCVLPLYHVSGLMQVVRAWISGGKLVVQPFSELLAGTQLINADSDWFISLVPTQLKRLIEVQQQAWLKDFRAILLGGAPAWPSLLNAAAGLPMALTYGMSETAAQVATLLPKDFAAGHRNSGKVLPHAQIEVLSPTGQVLPAGTVGRLRIKATSLAAGYLGDSPFADFFEPDDLGYLDADGRLRVLGRNSQKMITGGENVFPAEVEAALLATGQVEDVSVVGVPDPDWGQAVTAVYVPRAETVTAATLKAALTGQLSSHKHPKHWLAVAALPRNAQGKLNRQQVLALTTGLSTESALASGPCAAEGSFGGTHGE